MRIILAALLSAVLTACTTVRVVPASPAVGTSATGAATSRAAVDAFFAAIKAGDVQATLAIFGTKAGSSRETIERDALEMRIVTMQCMFEHDAVRVIGQPRQKTDSVFYKVELSKGARAQQSDVVTVTGPQARWYVASVSPTQIPGCAFD